MSRHGPYFCRDATSKFLASERISCGLPEIWLLFAKMQLSMKRENQADTLSSLAVPVSSAELQEFLSRWMTVNLCTLLKKATWKYVKWLTSHFMTSYPDVIPLHSGFLYINFVLKIMIPKKGSKPKIFIKHTIFRWFQVPALTFRHLGPFLTFFLIFLDFYLMISWNST